jgi:protein-S-isoprenylcysteine O-methyltransferase Ste14
MSNLQNKYGGADVAFPPPFVFLGLSLIGLGAEQAFSLRLPLPAWARLVAGGLAALAGLLLVSRARAWFVRTGQHPAPWRPSPELVEQGIYAYTRNPMYLGITLFQLGLGLALGSGWVATLAPLGLLIVHFLAVLPEESYLTEKFGDQYLRYRAAVRRYL